MLEEVLVEHRRLAGSLSTRDERGREEFLGLLRSSIAQREGRG